MDAGPVIPGQGGPGVERGAGDADVLRAKYHDYCSAQVADLLLYLTSDEIYLLAQRAARESGMELEEESYGRMVEVATTWLFDRAVLPPFEVWLEDYQAHPERYEEYFMGLWQSELEASPDA